MHQQHSRVAGLMTLAMVSIGDVALGQTPAPETPDATGEVVPAPEPVPTTPAAEETAAVEEESEPDGFDLASAAVTPHVAFRPGRGIRIESGDGRFELNIRLRGQTLYTYHQANDESDGQHSLELRRARLAFSGHWWGEDNRFKVELAVAPRDEGVADSVLRPAPTTPELLDWYMDFTQSRDATVRVGQFKVNFNRERIISSADIPMVDRSIVNGEFNLDRDVGMEVYSRDFLGLDLFRYTAGIYIGRGRNSVGFRDREGFMALGRVEFLPFGQFEDLEYTDFDRSDEPHMAIGLSGAYVSDAPRSRGILGTVVPDGVELNTKHLAADFLFRMRGLSLESEFLMRDGNQNGTPTDPAVTWGPVARGWGSYGEIGYLMPTVDLSINARYSAIRPFGHVRDAAVTTSLGATNELGTGLTYFFAKHFFEVQLDYFYLWTSGAEDAGNHRIRLQLQISL